MEIKSIMKIYKFKQVVCRPCTELDLFLANDLEVTPDNTYVLDGEKDSDREKAGQYGIMSTPTLVLVDDNGVEIDRVIGTNKEAVTALFEQRG
jgi:thioredoxin-related protein